MQHFTNHRLVPEETLTPMSDELHRERDGALERRPTSSQRQFMQRLRTDKWMRLAGVSVAAGPSMLSRLVTNGWIELRGEDQDIEVSSDHDRLEAHPDRY